MSVHMWSQTVYHFQKIFGRHILAVGCRLTAAATVSASRIAPQCTFPKKDTQLRWCAFPYLSGKL